MSESERERRIGKNEALFREVNERLGELNETFAAVTGDMEIVCECSDAGCFERFSITPDDYRRLRSDPVYFGVVPGHESPEIEAVVEQQSGYVVVAKKPGGPAETAQETERRLSR